ncbi:acyl carrier protein [Cereibacter azotoformans]|uniref:acyl carrier protein n=1 Tax=Cereibacter azotoformans TaxID=43057 RepID=UPI001F2361D8|nr:acyl carrier protein [Cereibacter azotoformans]
MIDRAVFDALLARYAKAPAVSSDDILFGSGLNISSIAFTEFVMDLEETTGLEIDIDDLDASIRTVGQLYDRLNAV